MGGAVVPLLINKASSDPRFEQHPGLQLYGIESYIAVPLNRRDGSYFGTLCALDPQPAQLSERDFDIFHLLSQLIAFELEADEQQQRREAALRSMEDFVAIAAHDLRQPLTALQGRAQLLARRAARNPATADVATGIADLARHARRAIQLSDMLLDAARIETDSLALNRTTVDGIALVHQVIEDVQLTAPNHTFLLDAPATLEWSVDERRLSQVLRNLLDNAAKYAPADRGPVTVTVARSAPPEGAATLLISVRDAGPGVPAEALPRLFERTYRTPGAIEQRITGSGLGLYIARQIVEAHGGQIWAEPTVGGGLTLQLTLPDEQIVSS